MPVDVDDGHEEEDVLAVGSSSSSTRGWRRVGTARLVWPTGAARCLTCLGQMILTATSYWKDR